MNNRRLLAFVLAVLLVVGTLPVTANATDNRYTEDEIYQLAADAFPEYADKILGRNTATAAYARSVPYDDFTTVFCETRQISETERVTYQEYANGENSVIFSVDQVVQDSMSGSGYSYYVVDIFVLSSLGVVCLVISQFAYTLVSGAYDQINSFGSTNTSTVDAGQYLYTRDEEGPAGPAFVQYYGDFPPAAIGTVAVRCILTINVGGNQCTVTTSAELVSA